MATTTSPLDPGLADTVAQQVCAQVGWMLNPPLIVTGVSNRHVHLSAEDLRTLFGVEEFTPHRQVRQPGEFAAAETVTVVGPKHTFEQVRCMGPCRKATQVEISLTDARALGLEAPVAQSGHLENAALVTIEGPQGTVRRPAAIAAARHIHMGDAHAASLGLKDQDTVSVAIDGPRGGIIDHVIIRTKPEWVPELHVDTDEANALGLTSTSFVRLIRPDGVETTGGRR
ncbi:MAG: phosphate propanoyltransferase [Propionibacteriaceae bacterium]|jgi:putative phosphotransacetylase|nr:phosphate propanoyltransferase [Propionibacteriaceae bacterium]